MTLLPPLPTTSINSRLKPIVDNIASGISVKIFGLPGVGKTSVYSWLANDLPLQKILKIPEDVQLLYSDLELTKTRSGNDLIIREINEFITNISTDKKTRVVLILDSTDILEYNKKLQTILSNYYQNLRPRLSFIFLFSKFYKDSELVKNIPLLKISLVESSLFFPFFNTKETEHAVSQWQKILKINLSTDKNDWFNRLSGGYAALLKKLIFSLRDDSNLVKEVNIIEINLGITNILDRLFTSFNESQKQILSSLATENTLKGDINEIEILKNFGVINEKNKLFSSLFEDYLVTKEKYQHEYFGVPFSENLTASELKILEALHDRKNKIVDRDTIAQALWGKAWLEKYSDWAIDKIVSQLRSKIVKDEERQKLKTFRGRGLRLSIISN